MKLETEINNALLKAYADKVMFEVWENHDLFEFEQISKLKEILEKSANRE